MDANQQRFWLLSDREDWDTGADLEFDSNCQRLRLSDRRPARLLPGDMDRLGVNQLMTKPSHAIDRYGTVAYWDITTRSIYANGGLGTKSNPVLLWEAPEGQFVVDLARGNDDILYVAVHELGALNPLISSFLGLFDPRSRWSSQPLFVLSIPEFTVDRIAVHPEEGAWVLDRERRKMARFSGTPLREGLPPSFSATTFRPKEENPNPVTYVLEPLPEYVLGEIAVEISANSQGELALLTRRPGRETWLHILDKSGHWRSPQRLTDPGEEDEGFEVQKRAMPLSIGWLSDQRIATIPGPRIKESRTFNVREAIPYDITDQSVLKPAGGFYPLRNMLESLFMKGELTPPHYPVLENNRLSRSTKSLSVRSFVRSGEAEGKMLDGGRSQTVWHRLYLEGLIPQGCSMSVDLAATEFANTPDHELSWFTHFFGEEETLMSHAPQQSRGVWLKDFSEIPHHAGLLSGQSEKNRAGLFTSLIQRSDRKVRRLTGRFLHVRIRMNGSGHKTPELAGLRIYASRFSYRDEYLADVYKEQLYGSDADEVGKATGADFLDRFLSLFESVLTPMEDRVATAHVMTDPRSTSSEALDWLATWVGVSFDTALPDDRKRAWIEAAPWLAKTNGTLQGLNVALEVATGGTFKNAYIDSRQWRQDGRTRLLSPDDPNGYQRRLLDGGGVTGGEIVVVEDYRLRRTFATILGANLTAVNDPLLPGLIVSANSRVGDTLFVGEKEKQELLALFRTAIGIDVSQQHIEQQAIRDFFGRLAHRVTVFVHDALEEFDFGMLTRVAEKAAPAHVRVSVVRASIPLLVGLSSLVDVDTYLGPKRPVNPVRVDQSRIGEVDFIRGSGALDPRLGGLI